MEVVELHRLDGFEVAGRLFLFFPNLVLLVEVLGRDILD